MDDDPKLLIVDMTFFPHQIAACLQVYMRNMVQVLFFMPDAVPVLCLWYLSVGP